MPASDEKVGSALESIARHEQTLLSGISEAEREAKHIVEAAHLEARRVLAEGERHLETELAELRREAEAARAREREAALQEAADKADRVRAVAGERVHGLVREIVALVLPAQEGEGKL